MDTKNPHVLLFSGHMIDAKDRSTPRFPEEKETAVRREIKKGVSGVLERVSVDKPGNIGEHKQLIGIAGGACGGDILFHEVCRELGITTRVLLALPPEQFIEASVRHAGESWVKRFYALEADTNASFQLMPEELVLPEDLMAGDTEYGLWQRNNLWILHTALELGKDALSFIAVWDGKEADGPGGTEHMIREVEKRGATTLLINPLKVG